MIKTLRKVSNLALGILFSTAVFAQIPTTSLIKEYTFPNQSLTSGVSHTLATGSVDLTATGSAHTFVTDNLNLSSSALSLNGSSFTAGGTKSANVYGFAVSFWIKTSTNDDTVRYLFDQLKLSNVKSGYVIQLVNGKIVFKAQFAYGSTVLTTSSVLTTITSSTVIADGNWHHIVCQLVPQVNVIGTDQQTNTTSYELFYNYQLYIDNVLKGSEYAGGNINVTNALLAKRSIESTQELIIGKSSNGAAYQYNDVLDQIRYYETNLTAPQILALYNDKFVPVVRKIKYVNQAATGTNAGTSWTNAFTKLESAISASTSGDTIWVAAGTYKPSVSDRAVSYLLKDGVKIFGGFNGTETVLTERNPKTNLTVLSGDLSGNDNNTITDVEATRNENSYHIMAARGNVSNVIVDGFTFSGGNANGGTLTSGTASAQYYHTRGGAIYINPYTAGNITSITFAHCIFEKNTGTSVAVFTTYTPGGTTTYTMTTNFDKCVFRNNYSKDLSALLYGGASQYNIFSKGVVNNCLFYNNTSATAGSCVYLGASSGGTNLGIDVKIINTTFAKNTGPNGNVFTMALASNTSIKNSIVYDNGGVTPFVVTTSGSVVSNTIANMTYTGATNVDPLFTNAATLDFSLQYSSPAVNTGSVIGIEALVPTTDLADNLRVETTTIDMGCYEYSTVTGFESAPVTHLNISPNPTSASISVQAQEGKSFEIYNSNGILIQSGIINSNIIAVENLMSGLYILKIENAIVKFVKE